MTVLDDAARVEVERLCDVAYGVIRSREGIHSAGDPPDPEIGAALRAIADRLRQAGVESQVADNTVTRWFIVQQPITEALEIEQDPPYETSRVQADLGHRKPHNDEAF